MDEIPSQVKPQDLLIVVPRKWISPLVEYNIKEVLGKEADGFFNDFQDAITHKVQGWKEKVKTANTAFQKIAGFSAYDLRKAARLKREELKNEK